MRIPRLSPRVPLIGRSPILRPSRRAFLGGAAATAAALGLSRRARAETVSAADRRFLFVYAMGGWDVTRVFAPLFDAANVAMEADAGLATAGNIPYVDHAARPSVKAFMDAYYDRVAIVNGFYISSISHSSATRLVTTGTPDASQPDWPSRLAAWHATDHVVPYLVIGGPNFSGKYGVNVGHAGTTGQLQGLANGDILAKTDLVVQRPLETDASLVDAYLDGAAKRRESALSGPVSKGFMTTFGIALDKGMELKTISETVSLDRGDTFSDQVALAANVLSLGISRVAAVAHPRPEVNVLWDSHTNNDVEQMSLFEDFFAEMIDLIAVLESTPGAVAPTLADETVVVVLSEMGRTPDINASNGKDHWPYTSAMMFGPGVRGNQVVGGFDDGQYGLDVDLATGLPSDSGSAIGPNVLGATLMMLGDIDPEAEGLVDKPVTALLE
jgi:uncharacterized protein (DUF1501 family)